ncbi:MAG: protein BatD [Chitinophagaceae bacterium]|nr:protein BatD [Chitinophagaceae bacterium]
MKYFSLHFLLKTVTLPLLLCSLVSETYAQKFTATANETEIGKNDIVQVEFRLENASGSINPPSFNDFEVLSGPLRESQMTSINGKTSSSQAIKFILRPLQPGVYIIPAATATVEGKVLRSNTVKIIVSNRNNVAPKNPVPPQPSINFGIVPEPRTQSGFNDYLLKPGEDAVEKIKKNIFIKMEADKSESYVGQPVVVSFKLYTRLRSETNITSAPSFNGFSVMDMDVTGVPTETEINGKLFNCHTLRKVQIFPMQAGTFILTPIEFNNKVTFIKDDGKHNVTTDPLLQLLQEFSDDRLSPDQLVTRSVELKSNELTLHVKPLPDKGVPPGFKGAVGKFSIETDLLKDQLTTDDAGTLQLTISGSGNLPLITAPEIKWQDGIDAFDAKIKENTDKNDVPVSGTKTFNIPFTISKAGDYQIPPVSFSWFNPETSTYQTATTEPISFHVSEGKGIASSGEGGKTHEILSNQLSKIAGIALGIGGLLLLFIVFNRRRKKKSTEIQAITTPDIPATALQPQEEVLPMNPLEKLHGLIGGENTEIFYKELEQSLKDYLSVKLKIPPHEFSRQTVLQRMDQCNVGIGSTQLFESLMNDLELGRYAKNFRPEQATELYQKTEELVSLLNKQIC